MNTPHTLVEMGRGRACRRGEEDGRRESEREREARCTKETERACVLASGRGRETQREF